MRDKQNQAKSNASKIWKNFLAGTVVTGVVVAGIASAANVGPIANPMPNAVSGGIIQASDINDLVSSITTLDARSFQKDASETRFNLPHLSTGDVRPSGTEVHIWDDGTIQAVNKIDTGAVKFEVYADEASLPSGEPEGTVRYVSGLGLFVFNGTDWTSAGGGSSANADSDNDGLPDSWEIANGVSDPSGDADSDGATNLQEYTAGTNPNNADSDGGGESDGDEIAAGRNPLDGADDVTAPDPLPSGITITAPGNKIIASVNDDNYLPITGPDGTADTLVDVQGTVTTTGTTLSLAYEVIGSSVDLPAFTQTVNVSADKTEDGQARDVTLSYPAQTLSVGTGTITATLQSVTDTLNAKKLDIDQNYQQANWLTLAEFTIALDGTNTAPVKLQAVPGIPDAAFGDGEHDFLYMPVVAADGTMWLNNVLGAEYNNVHSANFNPTQQATAEDDHLAYGSLFQWGRPADGHELRTCTDSTTCTSTYGDTSTLSSTLEPGNNSFIINGTSPYDWTTADSDGSQREAFLAKTDGTGICPAGFRLPTETELEATRLAENITNEASYLASTFKGVLSGHRNLSLASLNSLGTLESLWSSSADGTYSRSLNVNSSSQSWYSSARAHGFSARCLSED